MPSVIAELVGGQPAAPSIAGTISTPIVFVALLDTPQPSTFSEYIPVAVVPDPKLHPGDNTSCTIGQTEVVVSGQFNKTFPNTGKFVQPPEPLMAIRSMLITNEVKEGLFIPHGRTGGSKLCKYPSLGIIPLAGLCTKSFLSTPISASVTDWQTVVVY